ncbi:MAG TPA: glycoside hydrolase family 57 protein [Ktedonobacterales bacterium]|nr:glycoside hydrolase family 57 protein [Ktedonobacterales bacterium]
MATEIVIYTVVHQPRRVKLPAQPIPPGASYEDIVRCVFDERMNERYFRKVASTCYYPATEQFLKLVKAGMKLSIGFSVSFLRQAQAWDPALLARFQELVASPNVEIIGVEPYHSFLFLLDMPLFVERMRWMADEIERVFGKRPRITDTTEMCMSASLYDAVEEAGFEAALMDGRPWVMGWREPTHLYHYGGRARLFCRHLDLSDDVGYRFSNRTWDGFPLYAERYADWLRNTWGDFVFIGWDFETFGEHHRRDSGIFEFIDHLPEELAHRGAGFLTPSEALARFGGAAHHLPLPIFPTTWAGSGGMEFFLGNAAQQAIFQLMIHTFGVARLTRDPDLLDLAMWLAQSDNLHLIQWFGRFGPEAEVSAYFTPREWWDIGPMGIISEQQRVYENVLRAMEASLPARRRAQSRRMRPLAPLPAVRELEPIGIEARY